MINVDFPPDNHFPTSNLNAVFHQIKTFTFLITIIDHFHSLWGKLQVTLFSIVLMHIVCNVLRIFLGILVVSSIGIIVIIIGIIAIIVIMSCALVLLPSLQCNALSYSLVSLSYALVSSLYLNYISAHQRYKWSVFVFTTSTSPLSGWATSSFEPQSTPTQPTPPLSGWAKSRTYKSYVRNTQQGLIKGHLHLFTSDLYFHSAHPPDPVIGFLSNICWGDVLGVTGSFVGDGELLLKLPRLLFHLVTF